jgi:hypothetical protein
MNPEMSQSVHTEPIQPIVITTHAKINTGFCALFAATAFWLVMSMLAGFVCSLQIHPTCPDPTFPLLVREGNTDELITYDRCCTVDTNTPTQCTKPVLAQCDTFQLWDDWIVFSLIALLIIGSFWLLYNGCRHVVLDTRRAEVDELVRNI